MKKHKGFDKKAIIMASMMRRALHPLLGRTINAAAAAAAAAANQTTTSAVVAAAVHPLPNYNYGCYRANLGSILRFSTTNNQSFDIDFSSEESKRRMINRLLYRSKQRGFLELDLVLGKWVEDHISTMDEPRIKALVDVLDVENPDLWKWLSGQEQPPEALTSNPVFCAIHDKVLDNLNNHSSPETRATPGKPWVRGWDDLKRARDSPITGNQ